MSKWQHLLFRATRFERDRQVVVRALIVGAAFLTYLVNRDDVVWRFIKNDGAQTRLTEHWLFFIATAFIGIGAYLCTAARSRTAPSAKPTAEGRATRRQYFVGQFLYTVGLASLVPLAGSLILVIGEAVRLLRLGFVREDASTSGSTESQAGSASRALSFAEAARPEALKWALFVTMIVFTITLRDRYADVLICFSVLLSILLNWRSIRSCFADQAD